MSRKPPTDTTALTTSASTEKMKASNLSNFVAVYAADAGADEVGGRPTAVQPVKFGGLKLGLRKRDRCHAQHGDSEYHANSLCLFHV